MKKEIQATVTNALSKEAINMAGHHYSGHTEIYAEYTGTKKYAMMLAHHDFRVVHVSTHVSLREACDRVKKARVLEVIEIADQVCRDMGIEHPKVAVAGLNPHCGENGLFGREEIEEIKPAIDAAKAEGIDAIGPCPPDSVFSQAIGGWYDIVVVMYHDQGHIPIKTVGFVYDREKQSWKAVEGVNITLGLPDRPRQCGPWHRLCAGRHRHQQRAEPGELHRIRRKLRKKQDLKEKHYEICYDAVDLPGRH